MSARQDSERSVSSQIDRLLSRLDGSDPARRFRAEVVLSLCMLQILTMGLIFVSEMAWGTTSVGIVLLIGLVAIALVLWDLVLNGRVARAAIGITTIQFLVSVILNFGSGGHTIGVNIALPSLVLVGSLVLPVRMAFVLFLGVVVQLLLVSSMYQGGLVYPINPDPEWARMSVYRLPMLISVGTAFVGLLVRRAMARYRLKLASAQESLSASEKQLREIIEYSRGLICTHSLDGVLLSANPAAAQALSYEVDELLGINIHDLIPEEQRTQFAAYLARMKSDESDSGTIFLCARHGAVRIWEYKNRLCKDSSGVPYVLCNAMDMTERRRLEEKLREQNIRDPLTGCFNRRYLALAESRFADEQQWGCVIVDLDNFKQINDTRGHRGGDEVLVAMGRFLNQHARAGDAVVRMGGDEFLLLLSDGNTSTEVIAGRIRATADNDAPCDLSIGFASRQGHEALERTIERADQQLYQVRIAERRENRRRTPDVN